MGRTRQIISQLKILAIFCAPLSTQFGIAIAGSVRFASLSAMSSSIICSRLDLPRRFDVGGLSFSRFVGWVKLENYLIEWWPRAKNSRTGEKATGTIPFGFAYLEGELVKDPKEYKTVLQIRKLWKSGKSCSSIATVAILAVSSGKLPAILKEARVAQLHLLKDSQASKWRLAMRP